MKNDRTPQPGSEKYNVEKPQDLNTPKYKSATDKRDSNELPGVENMNDQQIDISRTHDTELPNPDLGNERDDDEDEKEKIIRR